jgi:chromosome segregation ATPase
MLDSQAARVSDLTVALAKMQNHQTSLIDKVNHLKQQADEAERNLKWDLADFVRKKHNALAAELDELNHQIKRYQETLGKFQKEPLPPHSTSLKTPANQATPRRLSKQPSAVEVLAILEDVESDVTRIKSLSQDILTKISLLKSALSNSNSLEDGNPSIDSELEDLKRLVDGLDSATSTTD